MNRTDKMILGAMLAVLALAVTLAATNKPLKVRWNLDEVRETYADLERQQREADEFNKTNTDPTLNWMITPKHWYMGDPLQVTTNDVELGFRSDGIVVWRIPPEAK